MDKPVGWITVSLDTDMSMWVRKHSKDLWINVSPGTYWIHPRLHHEWQVEWL